jgi:hypothetical protein
MLMCPVGLRLGKVCSGDAQQKLITKCLTPRQTGRLTVFRNITLTSALTA